MKFELFCFIFCLSVFKYRSCFWNIVCYILVKQKCDQVEGFRKSFLVCKSNNNMSNLWLLGFLNFVKLMLSFWYVFSSQHLDISSQIVYNLCFVKIVITNTNMLEFTMMESIFTNFVIHIILQIYLSFIFKNNLIQRNISNLKQSILQ